MNTRDIALTRRGLLALAAAPALPAFAQSGSGRAITIIAPFGAGGSTDAIARSLAEGMARKLGQSVVVENRAGASGVIGAVAAARAAPDGHTLFLGASTTQVVLPNASARLPYDPFRDFTPISMVAEVENALVVPASLPVQTMKELVDYCRARPGEVAYGSSGAGGITHLAGELFNTAAGVKTIHVAYKASSQVDVALLGGQLQFAFATLASAIPHIQSGRMRPLALASPRRSPFLPNVPTTAEAGYGRVVAVSWAGLYGPAKLEERTVQRLNAAAVAALREPALVKRFEGLIARALPSTPEGLASYQAREYARWGRVVADAGLKLES